MQMAEWKEGRKEGREGRLGHKSLTTRPGPSVLLLPKFHKTWPGATCTTALFGNNLFKNQIFAQTHVTLFFYYLFFAMCYSAE